MKVKLIMREKYLLGKSTPQLLFSSCLFPYVSVRSTKRSFISEFGKNSLHYLHDFCADLIAQHVDCYDG